MSKENNGGSAFPYAVGTETGGRVFQVGMTLRDYFAAQSLSAFIARPGACSKDMIAADAYEMADAMLKARDK